MKKHLAWILVLCMVFSLLPIAALAADPAASYVVFHDEDGNVIDSVASPAKAIDYVPAVSGQKMLGWTQTQGSADVDFAVGADVAAAADVALYPVVDSSVAVVRFVGNDDEASYTSTQYVEKGDKAAVPADPSAPGLAFTGWFADEDCTVPFDFDAPVAGDVAVYAGWEKVEVPFTVIVWMQKVTDSASASDAEKTYDFGCSFELKGAWAEDVAFGAVNAMLADVDLANLAVAGFHFNAAKTDAKVTTDRHGDAVLNVFYDRDVIKYVFTPNYGPSTTLVGLYGAPVAWPDGVWKYRDNQSGEHYTFRPYEGDFVVPFNNAGGNTVNFYNPRELRNEKYLSVTYELQQLDDFEHAACHNQPRHEVGGRDARGAEQCRQHGQRLLRRYDVAADCGARVWRGRLRRVRRLERQRAHALQDGLACRFSWHGVQRGHREEEREQVWHVHLGPVLRDGTRRL